jgi:transcriptional regulator with XRE-family HTH domain
MRRQGLTQQEVAERLGVSDATISNWENERSSTPGIAFVPEPPD